MQEIRRLLKGKRTLLVGNHPMDTEIIKRILDKINMDVVCVEDGKQALELYGKEREFYFDIMLMDVGIPEMEELSFVHQIRHAHRADSNTLPIIAVTAGNSIEEIHTCKEVGMNAHIAKPIEPQRLYQILCEHLQELI